MQTHVPVQLSEMIAPHTKPDPAGIASNVQPPHGPGVVELVLVVGVVVVVVVGVVVVVVVGVVVVE